MLHQKYLTVMLHQSKGFKGLWWALSHSWLQIISCRSSDWEVPLEKSCTFNKTQIILLSGTIGMELEELHIVPLTLWLPQVTGDPRNLGQSCDMTTIVSFVLRFFLLPWFSINHLICVKHFSGYFVIILSRDL